MNEQINILIGDIFIDDRGYISYVNNFNFDGIKRFYMIENHQVGFIRAWHGHKYEGKYITVVDGSALIGAVKIDDWEFPSKNLEVKKIVLSSKKPSILYIPPGFANGIMTLTQSAKVIVYSTSTLEESKKDDYRFDSRYWDIWRIEER